MRRAFIAATAIGCVLTGIFTCAGILSHHPVTEGMAWACLGISFFICDRFLTAVREQKDLIAGQRKIIEGFLRVEEGQ